MPARIAKIKDRQKQILECALVFWAALTKYHRLGGSCLWDSGWGLTGVAGPVGTFGVMKKSCVLMR